MVTGSDAKTAVTAESETQGMGSKHRRPDLDDGRFNRIFAAVTATVMFAAVASAAVVFFVGASGPYRQHAPEPAPVAQSVSQQGTLVAVSADRVTARSPNGFARTYLINADTATITDRGNRIGSAGTAFAVNDEVCIYAVVRDGTAIATTVADREVAELNGPPMDFVAYP
ncbi:hypothetical protein [Mycobacterium sp. URHB0044]|uniref:hypothetical protein n=1 Tax=Mycobacterium sp. URHB0044 TaxID=1380386 RepID=UPI0006874F15|nr:hypothetical protein [Mycobacterium sp. URHB0044]